jgi:hypothetical protein
MPEGMPERVLLICGGAVVFFLFILLTRPKKQHAV